MNVLVLGGGVIGVTSAFYLQRAGHEVTLLERQADVAQETSFANGGQVSWSSAHPWAEPGIPLTALRWLFKPHSPLVLRPRLDPALWSWLVKFLGNCTARRYAINKERQVRLARYSHACLVALRNETPIEYGATTRGTLYLYRSARELAHGMHERTLWEQLGVQYRVLDADNCIAHEPALAAVRAKLAGGILFPDDESGDCRRFTAALAQAALNLGVRFELQTTVQQLARSGTRIENVITDRGAFRADAYVLACGSYSPLLLKPLGIRLPVYPVKGYSVTLPIVDAASAPQATLTDERYKVVVTRLGEQLRAAGTAELGGYDLTLHPSRCATLAHVVRDLFPHAGDFSRAEYWTGLRPMTPDNPPVLGATPFDNLFVNTGHGTLGWTMACGSGKVLADILSQRKPEIDLEGLTLERFISSR
jgi:D-amino-acid dehydrogenase